MPKLRGDRDYWTLMLCYRCGGVVYDGEVLQEKLIDDMNLHVCPEPGHR